MVKIFLVKTIMKYICKLSGEKGRKQDHTMVERLSDFDDFQKSFGLSIEIS